MYFKWMDKLNINANRNLYFIWYSGWIAYNAISLRRRRHTHKSIESPPNMTSADNSSRTQTLYIYLLCFMLKYGIYCYCDLTHMRPTHVHSKANQLCIVPRFGSHSGLLICCLNFGHYIWLSEYVKSSWWLLIRDHCSRPHNGSLSTL